MPFVADINAIRHLVRVREIALRELEEARISLDAARAKRDEAQALIAKIELALSQLPAVKYGREVPPTATVDEVIARVVTVDTTPSP